MKIPNYLALNASLYWGRWIHLNWAFVLLFGQQMGIRLTSVPVPTLTSTSSPVPWSSTCGTSPSPSSRSTCTQSLFRLQVSTPPHLPPPLYPCTFHIAWRSSEPWYHRIAKCWVPTGGHPRVFAAAAASPLWDPPILDGSSQEVRFDTLHKSFSETHCFFNHDFSQS